MNKKRFFIAFTLIILCAAFTKIFTTNRNKSPDYTMPEAHQKISKFKCPYCGYEFTLEEMVKKEKQ